MSEQNKPKKGLRPGEVDLKTISLSSSDGGNGMLELPVIQAPQVENVRGARPDWLRVKLPYGETYKNLVETIETNGLHTVCQSARCPNMGECWGEGTATFMILGNICTRSCGFCNVATGRPLPVDWDEPDRVAQSILRMKVKHAVITSVDRDDLADGGSILWTETIQAIRRISPLTTMETLIPDFKANTDQLDRIIAAKPEIISHNLETVRRLTRQVRIQAQYDRSLETLTYLKAQGTWRTKSGIMLGLGETEEEVLESMLDLRKANVDVVTMGQYLQPTPKHLPVKEFVHPDVFNRLAEAAKNMGFIHVESGPLVRSSYHAEKHIR